MHQLTDLPDDIDRITESYPANSRTRTEGTRNHERMALDVGGVVLRDGRLYGPGTYHPDDRPRRQLQG